MDDPVIWKQFASLTKKELELVEQYRIDRAEMSKSDKESMALMMEANKAFGTIIGNIDPTSWQTGLEDFGDLYAHRWKEFIKCQLGHGDHDRNSVRAYNTQFTLPMNLKDLEGEALTDAIKGLLGGTLTTEQAAELLKLLGLEGEHKGLTIDEFGFVCAVAERLYYQINLRTLSEDAQQMQKGPLEKADFHHFERHAKQLSLNPALRLLLERIAGKNERESVDHLFESSNKEKLNDENSRPSFKSMSGLECFDEECGPRVNSADKGNFFGCYLLVSINPTQRGRTYIGFTVNPNRRITQHNAGRQKGGAKSTSGRGPWEMVLIVHGFPNDISALRVGYLNFSFHCFMQFEWAWQNPTLSRRLAKQVPARRSKESPFAYRFRVLGCMLRTGPWHHLGLTVRWIKQEYSCPFPTDCQPPLHMPILYGPIEVKEKEASWPTSLIESVCGLCRQPFQTGGSAVSCLPLVCPKQCSDSGQWHLLCLARHMVSKAQSDSANSSVHLIPLTGTCPSCKCADLFWPQMLAKWKQSQQR